MISAFRNAPLGLGKVVFKQIAVHALQRPEIPKRSFRENWHVRFGSKADMCSASKHVRFTPNSDRKSGLPQELMSALPPKADMCGALPHVRFAPESDIKCDIWECPLRAKNGHSLTR